MNNKKKKIILYISITKPFFYMWLLNNKLTNKLKEQIKNDTQKKPPIM